jgi:hypothetical protein
MEIKFCCNHTVECRVIKIKSARRNVFETTNLKSDEHEIVRS